MCSNIHQILSAMCLNLLKSPVPWGTSAKWLWLVAGGWPGVLMAMVPVSASCLRVTNVFAPGVILTSLMRQFLSTLSPSPSARSRGQDGGWWTVEVRGGRQRGGGGSSHLPSPHPPTPQHCTVGSGQYGLWTFKNICHILVRAITSISSGY